MNRSLFRRFAALLALAAIAAVALHFAPGRALADGSAIVPDDYDTLDEALADGITNVTLNQSDTLALGALSNVVINIGGGYTLSVNALVLNGGAITGGTVSGNVYLASGAAMTSACTGTVFVPLTLPSGVPAGATVLFSDGSSDSDGDPWYDRSKTISGYSAGGVSYTADGERIYTISYKDETGKKLSSGKNPATYTVSSGTVTIKALSDLTDYTFKGWYCDTIDANNYIKDYSFSASGVASDLVFTAAYEKSDGKAAAGAMGAKAGAAGGSAGGGAAATAATDASDKTEEPATAASTAPATGGGMRVQVANSRTKSVLQKNGVEDGLTVASFAKSREFPYEWVAACALLALAAALLCAFFKKRGDERTAAMYEKLNIHD